MHAPVVTIAQIYAIDALDRAAHRRRDAGWLAAARSHPTTRVVLLSELRFALLGTEEAPLLHAPTVEELGAALPPEAIFLGERAGVAWFALDLGAEPPAQGRWAELRAVSLLLPADDAALLAYARALAHWHHGHRFCGRCGAATDPVQGGHARQCRACGSETFPRTDPAVIVLVTHGERCLLARSPRFPPGMYSTLAGFVEAGESLEQTLRREVREEVGVELDRLVYRASQPWPFPQSLMLGFRATARDTTLAIDRDEIEDAVWLTRAELADPVRCPVRLPNRDSIARFLIEEWQAEGD
jgi:NAD+ diphosphatase